MDLQKAVSWGSCFDLRLRYRTNRYILYSQDPLPINRTSSPAGHTQGTSINGSASQIIYGNLPYGSWVAGEEAIHKRRRRSEIPSENKNSHESIDNSALHSDDILQPRSNLTHVVRPQTIRTASLTYPPTQNYHNGLDKSRCHGLSENAQAETNTTILDQLHLQARMQSPCHICHKKPRYKDELDHFTFCQECGERTCTICLRECLNGLSSEYPSDIVGAGEEARYYGELGGSADHDLCDTSRGRGDFDDGNEEARCRSIRGDRNTSMHRRGHRHKNKICSSCCVERGEEGDIFCVGCVGEEKVWRSGWK